MAASGKVARRALVVDDDAVLLELLTGVLVEDGFMTTSCEKGQAALKALGEQRYDLLLVDVGLPDMNGMQLCHVARQAYGDDMIIFVITGDNRRERVVSALEIGADDFIAKPFNTDELLARLEAKLRRTMDTPS